MASFNPALAGAGGLALGMGAGSLMSDWKNPADKAMPYMNQIPDMLRKYLEPYMNAGNKQLPSLENEYGNLTNDPGGMVNKLGANYHESPGFQFALKQALQGSNNAAAAGGMAGSPQHEQQNMGIATGLADQDYNTYLSHAINQYIRGLSGKEDLYNTGAKTGIGMGEDLSSVLANQAKLAYEGSNAQNQHDQGSMGAFMGGLGSLAAMLPMFL